MDKRPSSHPFRNVKERTQNRAAKREAVLLAAVMNDFGRCVILTGDEVLTPENRFKFRGLKRDIDQALYRLMQAAVADSSASICDIKLTSLAFAGALNWTARWHDPTGTLTPADIATKMANILVKGIEPQSHFPAPIKK